MGEWQACVEYLCLLYIPSCVCVVRDVNRKNGKVKAYSHILNNVAIPSESLRSELKDGVNAVSIC